MKTLLLIFSILSLNYANAGDHPHHISLFTGATHAHEISYGTVGLEYEYRLTEAWGIGGLYESIQTDPSTNVTLLFGCYHLGDLGLVVGLGKEEVHDHSSNIQRIGAVYYFNMNQFTIGPNVSYDFIEGGHSDVAYGVLWGMGF